MGDLSTIFISSELHEEDKFDYAINNSILKRSKWAQSFTNIARQVLCSMRSNTNRIIYIKTKDLESQYDVYDIFPHIIGDLEDLIKQFYPSDIRVSISKGAENLYILKIGPNKQEKEESLKFEIECLKKQLKELQESKIV